MKWLSIARQSRQPEGLLGEVVACAMSYDTARVNRIALEQLDPQPGEAILELGFGSGRALAEVGARARDGFVAGVDPSEIMLRHARFRNARFLRSGRMELQLGEAAEIPYPAARFDRVFAVHVLYFWPEPARELAEMHRVLRDDGLLLLGFRPKDDPLVVARVPDTVYHLRTIDEVCALLEAGGFRDIETDVQIDQRRQIVWARARKAAVPT
ncbi:MAG: class I SAM-dependent methyltransferase [Myxococcota bacterium]